MEYGAAKRLRLIFFYAGGAIILSVVLVAWFQGLENPFQAFLFSLGVTVGIALLGCWFALARFHRLTKGHLRFMDLIWVAFSSVAIASGLLQVVGLPSDQRYSDILAGIERAETAGLENISAFERSCEGIECAWIGRMRDAVSKRRLLQPEVDEHCPSSTHATLCSRLKESAARVSELDEFHCQQERVRWFRYPLIFFGLAALTVRFPKSVVELLLNTDNRDLIVKRVPGQPVPTFFGEMAQGWVALKKWVQDLRRRSGI